MDSARRLTVDVANADELDRAIAAGIDPMHIVMHPQGRAAAPIRRAVNAGAARFVVGSSPQIEIIADSADRIQRSSSMQPTTTGTPWRRRS